MPWCPYTDREIEPERSTAEHIIPLSLGGCDELVIPVDSDINSDLGNDIDGKVTKDFIVQFLRRERDARGHSGEKPRTVFKKATFEGRPAQVEFLGGNNLPLIWDAKSASYVDSVTVPGKSVTVKFAWDRLILFIRRENCPFCRIFCFG